MYRYFEYTKGTAELRIQWEINLLCAPYVLRGSVQKDMFSRFQNDYAMWSLYLACYPTTHQGHK